MNQRELSGLLLFKIVAEEGSFTRAARKLGRSQSGLSQAINVLEQQLGMTLLARSTRSVRPTEAGLQLMETLAPALRQIDNRIAELNHSQGVLAGTLRLSVMEYPARTILVPALPEFQDAHPHLTIELEVSDRFVDIVTHGFDAGIRLGSHLEQDMIAAPLGPDVTAVVVGSLAYFERHGVPGSLEELASHACLNYRRASHGDIYNWQFNRHGRQVEVPVKGPLITNDRHVMMSAVQAGLGLAYLLRPYVEDEISRGQLKSCLDVFCPVWPGYRIYYPARNQKSKALSALITHLRSTGY